MSSTQPPPGGHRPTPTYGSQTDARPVSFYVAIFLGLLLLVSGALNLLLLVVSAFGSATAGFATGSIEEDSSLYQIVAVDGDAQARSAVLRVPIEGAISETPSPLIGAAGGTVSQVRRALRAAARDDNIKAVLLDINSPGGGVTDSDEIWRLITAFRGDHPDKHVVALFGDTAASGGYYIAAACERIIARPTTITGSIGVIISSLNYGKALEKIGVEQVTIVSPDTPHKDMLSPTRPMEPIEREKITAIVQEMYDRFVDIVDGGRPMLGRAEVKAAATGEIYSASRALELGLVDEVGTIEDAYTILAEMVGDEKVRVVEQRRIPTFFDTMFGARQPTVTPEAALAQLLGNSTGPRLLYYWQGGR